MSDVTKGSKTVLTGKRHVVEVVTSADLADTVDVTAVLLGSDGKVRSDNDLVFYNNPRQPGVELTSTAPIAVDLSLVPHDIHRVLIAGSTEAQGKRFADVHNLVVAVRSEQQTVRFGLAGLSGETVLQMVAFYRRGGEWKLDAIGQGYDQGLAAFATDHGIEVETDGTDTASDPTSSPPAAQSAAPAAVNFEKVKIELTKHSSVKTARIDLRKSRGEQGWVLTVGLEWDGRGTKYGPDGRVIRYGTGDLDVYFFCRNEETDEYLVISGERGQRGRREPRARPRVRRAVPDQGGGEGLRRRPQPRVDHH